MIRILGVRRVAVLLCLLVLNIALGVMYVTAIAPHRVKKEQELQRLRGQISSLQANIKNIELEMSQLEVLQDEFNDLKANGFFNRQSRRTAQDSLKKAQEISGVQAAVANIRPARFEPYEAVNEAGHTVLKSTITVDVKALDDVAVFRYLREVQAMLPGHVSIRDVDIKRTANITGVVLRSIAAGQRPALVEAKLEMDWRTLISDDLRAETGDAS